MPILQMGKLRLRVFPCLVYSSTAKATHATDTPQCNPRAGGHPRVVVLWCLQDDSGLTRLRLHLLPGVHGSLPSSCRLWEFYVHPLPSLWIQIQVKVW